jgi:hypothetical protein
MAQQLTTQILTAALENLASKRQQLDEQIAQVRRLLDGNTDGAFAGTEPATRNRTISEAGKRAIAEAQKRRWAAKKAASAEPAEIAPKKPKRKLSAEGRRNIVAALKKRWAAKRAGASTESKKVSKKPARKASAKRAQVKAAPAAGE